MEPRERDPFEVPAERAEAGDDPFARAAAAESSGATSVEPSVSVIGPLAQRDPHAPPETSDEFDLAGATSFEDVLRRASRRGFLAGAAVGVVAAAAIAVAVSWATSGSTGAAPPAEPLAAEQAQAPSLAALEPPAPRAPEARPLSAARDETRAARAREKRRDPLPRSLEATRGLVVPGLFLRAPEEPPADAPTAAAPAPEPAPAPAPTPPEAAPARQLEDAEVVAALATRRDDMDRCIAAHPADVAEAGGRRFHLVVTIDQTGRVARARIDDADFGATALGSCLVRLARDLRFDPFDGEPVRVELPLRLAGGDGERPAAASGPAE